ncbi:MAG: glycoside hydrolase family 31 protein [Methylobacteriaceae bacterium]|nr:glycoside hydrolase family 31 protein [Methylobacteriaceae bacterium]
MTTMAKAPRFTPGKPEGARITLSSPEGHVAHIFVLEEDIIRVMVLPGGVLHHPRGWAVAPGAEDVADTGRDRFDLSGFSCPAYSVEGADDTLVVKTGRLILTVALDGLFCRWQWLSGGKAIDILADRSTQSYNFGWWDKRVYHYLNRPEGEMYFGLGERAGETDRAGGRYTMVNFDAMGYSARTTDPLYKHIPFYITWSKQQRLPVGLYYDTHADCAFDMGREMDNYHGHYRYFVAEAGDLDYYVIGGDTLTDIVRRFTWLTGRPAMSPKWALGYSGSTMSYTEAPDAQQKMDGFLDKCAEHDILCSSFHLSSGYTSIGAKRYVFNWNRDKFPDPKGFVARYLEHGVRLIPNIKPCLLQDHPLFDEAKNLGLFVKAADGGPEMVQFWDEVGAYLDFTNPAAQAWWRAHVTEALLDYGMAATWNDNNEFEIWSETAVADSFGAPRPAAEAKSLHTLLMIRASHQAQRAYAPQKRPFLVSRAGATGMHRYVQTWSGDNYTSWETVKYNIKMSIGLSLSGISNIGNDVGGFSGPSPDPELFVRWVQSCVLQPRFSIHSWNDDGTVNEPWMHPAVTGHVRDLIRFRYAMLPYLYSLLWRYRLNYEPFIRPTFLEFPHDSRCFEANDDLMIGAALLQAPVVEPGKDAREVYLPAGTGWYDFWRGDHYPGGQSVTLPAPFDRPPLMAREGAALPFNAAELHFKAMPDERGFMIFPPKNAGTFFGESFEDDGESAVTGSGKPSRLILKGTAQTDGLSVEFEYEGPAKSLPVCTTLTLPATEQRPVRVTDFRIVEDTIDGEIRRLKIVPA